MLDAPLDMTNATQVIVWRDKSFAHCEEESRVKDNAGDAKENSEKGNKGKFIYGGPVLDSGVIRGANVQNNTRRDPTR